MEFKTINFEISKNEMFEFFAWCQKILWRNHGFKRRKQATFFTLKGVPTNRFDVG